MKRFVTIFVFSALLSSGLALAQGLGALVGAVTDPSGAAVPNAEVTATEAGTS